MANTYVLYNPISGDGATIQASKTLEKFFEGENLTYFDVTKIASYANFFAGLQAGEKVVLCGGDGTLYRFANAVQEFTLQNDVYYYPTGSGNDFWSDINKTKDDGPVLLNDYLKDLPTVTVKGQTSAFINGVGYGIDGYCCEEGDRLRAQSNKPVNYAGIAIKGLLFHFKPKNAVITVDGQEYTFKKVWIAATMHGRYYGGGMIPAPQQIRNNADGTVSLFVWHGSGKLSTLMAFPSIFKGEHVKKTKMIKILTGKEITVRFDKPTPCQIDGETVSGVTEYTVKSGKL
jgi:diacylglycerol kinase family enzyme